MWFNGNNTKIRLFYLIPNIRFLLYDLFDINLYDIILYDINLYDINLYDINLYDINLFDINLYDINLYDINLFDINLYDINLYDINLYDINPCLVELVISAKLKHLSGCMYYPYSKNPIWKGSINVLLYWPVLSR